MPTSKRAQSGKAELARGTGQSNLKPISHAMQDYLKVMHGLGGDEQVISTLALAEALGVRSSSATGMLKRLAEAGWVDYESGRGGSLTARGIAEARRVIRRHRLVELFLTRVLALDWSEVDAEAEALEHAISPRLEEALAAYLGEPPEDPHGHPIPTAEGAIHQRRLKRLCDFRAGQRVVIREAQDDEPGRLRRWRELGLTPGAVITLLQSDPLDNLIELEVAGTQLRLGPDALAGLRGELAEPTAGVGGSL